MKEFEREVISKQIVYEITKEELEAIKRDAREKGRVDVAEYIGFCWVKFYLEKIW